MSNDPEASEYTLKLSTQISSGELREKLKKYSPWGHRVDFDNGVSTKDCERRTPFSHNTIQKAKIVEKIIPFNEFKNGNVLDIGCNSGHNSIYIASQYDMNATGIDVTPRHIEVSNFLSEMAGLNSEFFLEDAETYTRDSSFDVVLHFGTLYHLPNPFLSLKTTYDNLREGGYLALETQVYDHPEDENICYFMNMQNNDPTNFWALSSSVLVKYLKILGYKNIQQLLKVQPELLEKNMSRIIVVAQK